MSFARPATPQQQQQHQRIQRAFVAPPSENLKKYGFVTASAVQNAKTAHAQVQRKAKIDSLVGETFTATPQRNAQIARQFKSMNLSPAEVAYISHSSRVRGDIAMQRANPYNTLLATLGQSGINPHAFEHPIARLTDKGEFAPHGTLGYYTNRQGKRIAIPRPTSDIALPFGGGPEAELATELRGVRWADPAKEPYSWEPLNAGHADTITKLNKAQDVYDTARAALKEAEAKGLKTEVKGKSTLSFENPDHETAYNAAKKSFDKATSKLGEAKNEELYTRAQALHGLTSAELADSTHFGSRQDLAEQIARDYNGTRGALAPAMSSVLGIHHVIGLADRLATLGEYGRNWYENSAAAIKQIAGGDVDRADKLAQLVAIYSPQQPILGNTSLAFRAYNEFLVNEAKGLPWDKRITTGTKDQIEKAQKVLADKGDWPGRKTNNFYVNFLEDINPDKYAALQQERAAELVKKGGDLSKTKLGREVTADLWMARAFGYRTDAVSHGRYDVIEQITRKLAEERGWKPKQVQAAIWTAVKDISPDVTANIDFATAFDRHMAQVNYEAAIGTDPELKAAYESWSPEVQNAFLQHKSALVDNFVQEIGLLSRRSQFGPSVWLDETSPGAQLKIGTSTAPRTGATKYTLPRTERNLLNVTSSAIARALKQDSVVWLRPFKATTKGHADLIAVDLGRVATPEEASALASELGKNFAVVHHEDGLLIKQIAKGKARLPNIAKRKGEVAFQDVVPEAVAKIFPDQPPLYGVAHDGELARSADYAKHLRSAFGNRRGSGQALRFAQASDRLSREAEQLDAAYVADPERAAGRSAELAASRRVLRERNQLLFHDPHGLAHGLPIEPPPPPPVRPPETAPPGVPPPEAPVEAGEPGATGQGVGPMPAELTDLTGQPAAPSDPQTLADMVQEAMRSARYTRARTRSMQSIERGERFNRARQAYVDAGGGIAGHQAMLDELRGELPSLDWGGFKNVDEHSIEAMLRTVYSHSRLRWGEKIRTAEAIIKGSTGEVWTPSEMKLLGRVFPPKAVGSFKQWAEAAKYFAKWGVELFNVPRALMASFDMSAPFRQGLVAGAHNPLIFARNFKTMVKAGMSERYAQEVEQWIRSHPHYQYAVDFRLPLTDHEHGLANTEEQFIGRNLAEKIPIAGHGVKASSRAYESFLNKTRMDLFSKMIDGALAQGLDPYAASRSMLVEHGLTLSNKGDTLGESIARYVGTATGRGTVGNLTDHAATMNALMFSPRLLASRLNLLNPVYYAQLDPYARKQALFSMAKLVTAGMSVLGAAKLAGAQVTMNPLNSDFGKIKIGNTRIDIWGGFQQPIRLFAQLIMGMQISPTTGKHMALTASGIGKVSRYDIAVRFLQSKLAPIPSSIVDLSRQQNFAGQPVTAKSLLASHVAPLMLQDMWSMYHPSIPFAGVKGQPASPSRIGAAVGAGALSGLGVGVASFGAKTPVPSGAGGFFGGGSGQTYFGGGGGTNYFGR